MKFEAGREKIEPNGRPPRGGRGLKSWRMCRAAPAGRSPPSRGAWIEISREGDAVLDLFVAPLAGGVD